MSKQILGCKDNAFARFKPEEWFDFWGMVSDIDGNTNWVKTPTSSISVSDVSVWEEYFDEEAYQDTQENTHLAVHTPSGGVYMLGSSARKSLFDRAQISGFGLTKLTSGELTDILNMVLHHQRNESMLMIRDEKVRFIASADAHDYSPLPVSELVGEITYYLQNRFPSSKFNGGRIAHDMTEASWIMPEHKSAVLESYNAIYNRSRYREHTGYAQMIPAISLFTSDTGLSAAAVSARIIGGSVPIDLGYAAQTKHRNGKTVDDFADSLSELYGALNNSVEHLMALTQIELNHPLNAIINIAKASRIPKSTTMEVVTDYRLLWGDDPMTAHDVYLVVQEILWNNEHTDKKLKEGTTEKDMRIRDAVSGLLSLTERGWHNKYDIAGEVKW